MRDETVIALLLLLIVASGGAGYYLGNSGRQTVTTTATSMLATTATATSLLTTSTTATSLLATTATASTTQVMSGCSRPYSISTVEGKNSSSSAIVFDLNSTAWACVAIYNNSNMSLSGSNFSPTVWIPQNGSWVSSQNLNVTVQPPEIQAPPNSESWYVLRITPLNVTKAIYLVGLPTVCEGFMVVGVGYSVSQLQALRVSLPTIIEFCPASYGGSRLIATTNMIPTFTQ
jgi:hypothetical protein